MYFYILFSALFLISTSWMIQAYVTTTSDFTDNLSMYTLVMNAIASFLLLLVGIVNGFTIHSLAFFLYFASICFIIHYKLKKDRKATDPISQWFKPTH